jgi:hypothetical protein
MPENMRKHNANGMNMKRMEIQINNRKPNIMRKKNVGVIIILKWLPMTTINLDQS